MKQLINLWPIIAGAASVVGSLIFVAYNYGSDKAATTEQLEYMIEKINKVEMQGNVLLMQVNDITLKQQAGLDSIGRIKEQLKKIDNNGQLTNKVLSRHIELTDKNNTQLKDLIELYKLQSNVTCDTMTYEASFYKNPAKYIDSCQKKTYFYASRTLYGGSNQMLNLKSE